MKCGICKLVNADRNNRKCGSYTSYLDLLGAMRGALDALNANAVEGKATGFCSEHELPDGAGKVADALGAADYALMASRLALTVRACQVAVRN